MRSSILARLSFREAGYQKHSNKRKANKRKASVGSSKIELNLPCASDKHTNAGMQMIGTVSEVSCLPTVGREGLLVTYGKGMMPESSHS